jgi:hypothetical protein
LEATSRLLEVGDKSLSPECINLFYTREEAEEIF